MRQRKNCIHEVATRAEASLQSLKSSDEDAQLKGMPKQAQRACVFRQISVNLLLWPNQALG